MNKYITLLASILLTKCIFAQSITKNIVIDQFGYRGAATKIAIVRNPKVGFDAGQNYVPGNQLQIIDADSKKVVFEGDLEYKTNGENDATYGDEVWWFDFSELTTDGTYYVYDPKNSTRSYSFRIADNVYNSVLKDAVRMLFYQRAGCDKKAKYAGKAWADDASHLDALQDSQCRLFSSPDDASTERDLRGGWYDAGDYNKYTVWGCNYVEILLNAYRENPDVWTDDYNIPESGNGIPDLLDEVKWELDWILRMQESNGSVLSIVGLQSASPPSACTGQSLYGPATTNASYAAAKAFAIGAIVYKSILPDYANTLKNAAVAAWKWAEANPSVEFSNSQKVGAGEQEGGASVRLVQRLNASLYLYEVTGESSYLSVFESNYTNLDFFKWYSYMDQYRQQDEYMLLRYLTMDGVSSSIKETVAKDLQKGFYKSEDDLGSMLGKDAYRSYCRHYNWGSNSHKCTYGNLFYAYAKQSLTDDVDIFMTAAEDYIHYIHGVNPFAMVYLTNMNDRGASNSINQMYHSWFCNGSDWWDDVTTSLYGPAPGYLIGGAYGYPSGDSQKTYEWASCCPNGCGSQYNNSLCNADWLFNENEPFAKRYRDFNDGWPVNSWQITEPSCGYQVNYIKLLSKFVAEEAGNSQSVANVQKDVLVYPNPVKDELFIVTENTDLKSISLFNMQSQAVYSSETEESNIRINVGALPRGVYVLQIFCRGTLTVKQVMVN